MRSVSHATPTSRYSLKVNHASERLQSSPVLPLLRIAGVVAFLLVALALVAWFGQRHLLYFPRRTDLASDARLARSRGLEPWLDSSGAFLGWRAAAPGGTAVARAIVLHGNAGSALDRDYLRQVLQAPGLPPMDVFLLEYPGYGARGGEPTESAIVAATVQAIDLLGPDLPVLLVGESLGSAAAALAAAARPGVAGLLLVTPLTSVPAVAGRHYPFVPSFLHRDTFRADQALPRYGGRVAFLVAGRDEVTFPDLARDLFQAYPGPKRLWEEPAAGHNTVPYRPGSPLWTEITGFLLGYTSPR
jgi:pimeloyl-ACP methyl ester carboxylesterase